MKRALHIIVLAAVMGTLLCLAVQAGADPATCTVRLDPGAAQGNVISNILEEGSEFVLPDCTYDPPDAFRHFGCWWDMDSGESFQPRDVITVNSSRTFLAQWYFDSEYNFSGELAGGMAWEMHIGVGDSLGQEAEGAQNKYLRSAWLAVTGEGAMPDFAEKYASPWDAILYALHQAGLYNRTVTHESPAGSWQEAVPIEITLDDRITAIGSYCFTGDMSMFYETIHLPESLRRIEHHAFYGNRNLFNVQFPAGLKYIGDYAFYECFEMAALTDEILSWYYINYAHSLPYDGLLIIPDSVTYIGSYAFAGVGMYRVALPHGLKAIQEGTFMACTHLNYAYLPETLISIGDQAFKQCGRPYIGFGSYGHATLYEGYKLSTIPYSEALGNYQDEPFGVLHFPASLRTLGVEAFYECSGSRSVSIPEGVKVIPEGCFAACRDLRTVTLPESLTEIGSRAFLKNFYTGNSVSTISEITIPRGVTVIGDLALGFRSETERQYLTVYGYRDTEAQAYVDRYMDPAYQVTSSSGDFTFVPLDEEDFYLFGVLNGEEVGCGGDAESLGDYKFAYDEETDSYTLGAFLTGECFAGVKRDAVDKDGPGVYWLSSPEDVPEDAQSAQLESRGETADPGKLLHIPAGGMAEVLFTLTRDGGGVFTLSYEILRDFWITGDITGWDEIELILNEETGKYEYIADLDPRDSWHGLFEFYLILNGEIYGSNDCVFDTVEALPLEREMNEEGNYEIGNVFQGVSAAGTYTYIFDPDAWSLTVTGPGDGAFLCLDQWSLASMRDPTVPSEEEMEYEEGNRNPSDPYLFQGDDTVWAMMRLGEGEYTLSVGRAGHHWGSENANVHLTRENCLSGEITLTRDQTATLTVDEANEGIYDFYYARNGGRLVVHLRPEVEEHWFDLIDTIDKPCDGLPVSFDPNTQMLVDEGQTTWASLVKRGIARYVWREAYDQTGTILESAPTEVGDYKLCIQETANNGKSWEDVDSFWVTVYPPLAHTYALARSLDKLYDGEPIAFSPESDLLIDGGDGAWDKEIMDYCWLERTEYGYYADIGHYEKDENGYYIWVPDQPVEAGTYRLTILEKVADPESENEEEPEYDWVEAVRFPVRISDGSHSHVFGEPVWAWDGVEAADAVFTCEDCDDPMNPYTETVPGELCFTLQEGAVLCTATVIFADQEYTDSKLCEAVLVLPAGLKAIAAEVFAAEAEEGRLYVLLPDGVTAMADDAFAGREMVTLFTRTYSETAAAYADSHGFLYFPLDGE